MPNDQEEIDRMDLELHNQLLQLGGELYACPLADPQEVLDLGAGTGIWAIEMAGKVRPFTSPLHSHHAVSPNSSIAASK